MASAGVTVAWSPFCAMDTVGVSVGISVDVGIRVGVLCDGVTCTWLVGVREGVA